MCCVLLWQPSDLVNFFFYLHTLQVVKVRLVALKRAVDIVLPRVPCLAHLLWFTFRLPRADSEENTAFSMHLQYVYEAIFFFKKACVQKVVVLHCKLTSVSLWKMTTRPPLSPVARRSPVWLNSTVEMTSAVRKIGTLEAIKQKYRKKKRKPQQW